MIKLEEMVSVLHDSEVEFVLIGGTAMGVQGSAHLTKDIDFHYERTSKNIERLVRALQLFHPVLRGAPTGPQFNGGRKAARSLCASRIVCTCRVEAKDRTRVTVPVSELRHAYSVQAKAGEVSVGRAGSRAGVRH
jgi:hypothetical protein